MGFFKSPANMSPKMASLKFFSCWVAISRQLELVFVFICICMWGKVNRGKAAQRKRSLSNCLSLRNVCKVTVELFCRAKEWNSRKIMCAKHVCPVSRFILMAAMAPIILFKSVMQC